MDLLAESITEIAISGEVVNTNRVLNIAYGIDRNSLFGAAVSIQPVAMHNPDPVVKFHFFTDYIDEDYPQRVNAFTNRNVNVEVRIYKVFSASINIFPSLKQWSYVTFFHLAAFQYLSEAIGDLSYIDAGIICKNSLAGLLDISFDGDKFVAVVRDVPSMQEEPTKRLAIEELPGNCLSTGVVYLQLEARAKNGFMNKVIAMLVSDPQHTKYKCLDQDILNILFFSHCIFISGDCNCSYGIDCELKDKSDEDYKKTITNDAKLVHYIGVMKSWND